MIKLSLIALLLFPQAQAQDPAKAEAQGPKKISVRTKDGRTERVEVISREGDRVMIKTFVLGGTVTLKRKLDDFVPSSVFRIEEQLAHASTFEQHFALAKKAGDLRLLGPAGSHARDAIEAAGGKKDSPQALEVRKWAGNALEEMTVEAVAGGDLRMAKHYLELLSSRLADQRSEEQLQKLADSVEGLKVKAREDKRDKRQAKLDERTRKDIQRRLGPIHKNIAKGDKLKSESLAKSRNTSASARLAGSAIKAYKSAWKSLGTLVKKHPDDDSLKSEAAAIGTRVQESAISAALHAASMLTVQSDYKGAMTWANKVLAFDPENADAKRMVQTITIAQAASGNRWGWGWAPGGSVGGRVGGGGYRRY